MRQRTRIWSEGTDPDTAFAAFRIAQEAYEAAQIARGQLLQAAVDVATESDWSTQQIAEKLDMSRSHIARLRPKKFGLVTTYRNPTIYNEGQVQAAIHAACTAALPPHGQQERATPRLERG